MRLARIMARDGINREAALLRMNSQPSEGFYLRDGVIELKNDHTPAALTERARSLVEDFKRRWQ